MNKTLLVLKYEVITTITRPSFLFLIFGIPLIGALVFGIASRLNQSEGTSEAVAEIISGPQDIRPEGYVDQSGLVQSLPESVPPGVLVAYPDEGAALTALEGGEISAYYVIPPDYMQTGKVTYVRPDFNPLAASGQSGLLEWVLKVNLLDGDMQLAALTNGPLDLEDVSLGDAPQRDEGNMLTFFLPYGVTIVFYMVILGAATLLLNSVSKEKENRLIEILMMSLTPQQMLSGKIIGLGLIGLLQTVVWVGTGRVLLSLSGNTFNLPEAFQLPVSFLVWGVVFFLLGYAVYASLMAGLGALVPNLREASQATFVVIMPLIIPMFLISVLIEAPHGALSVGLSLFPMTAPVAMMTRLSAGGVPAWQPVLAAVLLAGTAVLIVRAVARMFHAQTLLSGQAFNVKRYLSALLGKG